MQYDFCSAPGPLQLQTTLGRSGPESVELVQSASLCDTCQIVVCISHTSTQVATLRFTSSTTRQYYTRIAKERVHSVERRPRPSDVNVSS